MRSHLGGLIDGDDGATWDLQEAHLLRDFHVAHHRTAVEGHLAAVCHSGVDSCLDAVNVGGEGGQDNALLSASNEALEVGRNITLRCRNTGDGCVGGITQHEVNTLITIAGQGWEVRWTVIQRGLVQLDVTGVDDIWSSMAMTDSMLLATLSGRPCALAPCTAEAVIAILDHYGIEIAGARAAVVGRSNVIGRPVAALLTMRDATVTLCHSRTVDLPSVTREAEILVM